MLDAIKSLNDRDDEGRVTVEMWHDTESLQRIAERAMTGIALSQKGMQNLAEREALAVSETTIDIHTEMDALYPDIVEQLKEEVDHDQDYEYTFDKDAN